MKRGRSVASRFAAALLERAEGGAVAARRPQGDCSFFDAGTRLCEIHRVGGRDALPVTCRMFPRIVLHDARGTFITLSHFCPTAASLLFAPGPPAAIVDAPPALADVGPLDGLDARDAWPPLLRPGVLMDLESYDAWERAAVALLTRDHVVPDAAVTALAVASQRIADWTPGTSTLLRRVDEAFGAAAPPMAPLADHDPAIKRWLAARIFGAWSAYQTDGLVASVARLRLAFTIFTTELAVDGDALEAVRRSDLRILHEP